MIFLPSILRFEYRFIINIQSGTKTKMLTAGFTMNSLLSMKVKLLKIGQHVSVRQEYNRNFLLYVDQWPSFFMSSLTV